MKLSMLLVRGKKEAPGGGGRRLFYPGSATVNLTHFLVWGK